MRTKQNRPGREIVRLLKNGMPPKDIKNKLHVCGCAVRYWAIKLGMPPFSRGRSFREKGGPRNRNFKADAHRIAKEMRLSGDTFKAIGRTLGVTRQRAHQYFLEADL